jgi:GNAT superfamily N-acetyltransferase
MVPQAAFPRFLSAVEVTMKTKPRSDEAGAINEHLVRENGLVVRDAHPEELNDISLLIKEAYMEYRHSLPLEPWKFYLENMMDVGSRLAVSDLIVAELDKQLVGAVTLYLKASASSQQGWPQGWAGVRILAVRPAYRRRGVGRALMEECIRRCRKQGIKAIGLHTGPAMTIGRKMYGNMGFVRAPEYDFEPRTGIVVMAYRLEL